MKKELKRILVVRNDRLGDVVLATPVFEALKRCFPSALISAFIRPAYLELIKGNPFVDLILLDDYEKNRRGFFQLVNELKKQEIDAAVVLVPTLRMALAIFLARIPVRIGPGSHLYSFILFSRIKTQHRSRALKNEAQYNLELLQLLEPNAPIKINLLVKPSAENLEWAEQKLDQLKLCQKNKKLLVIHPGSGGSVLTWDVQKWVELTGKILSDKNLIFVFTGTNQDRVLVQKILSAFPDIHIPSLLGQDTVGRLAALLSKADALVSSNTGPMHLAVSVGTFSFAIFSPIPVQGITRWGHWHTKKKKSFVPDIVCPAKYKCLKEKCQYFFCMNLISPDVVYNTIKESLGKND
jgi:ADP-heptose:LPS heptosyltransferase